MNGLRHGFPGGMNSIPVRVPADSTSIAPARPNDASVTVDQYHRDHPEQDADQDRCHGVPQRISGELVQPDAAEGQSNSDQCGADFGE